MVIVESMKQPNIPCNTFWNLPEVKDLQEREKVTHYFLDDGSVNPVRTEIESKYISLAKSYGADDEWIERHF